MGDQLVGEAPGPSLELEILRSESVHGPFLSLVEHVETLD
jgi:hypothetical protein